MAVVNLPMTPALEAYIDAGAKAGLDRVQLERFITSGYFGLEGMLPFHGAARRADNLGEPDEVALGGKRGPGKSHAIMAQVGLDDCQRVPGLKVLFLRKVMKSAAESLGDLAQRVYKYTSHTIDANKVTFPNGSRILLGGYNNERDIDKYLGIEYDLIVIEEVTQITEIKKQKLRGSLRTSKDGWRPRMYFSTNADGIGLSWFKKDFVMPAREGRKTRTYFLEVSSVHNPYVNVEYEEWLNSLTGALRAAWRDGDWDAFEGMAFPMWDYDRHTCDPFPLPANWPKWRGEDWGSYAPLACYWLTKNPDSGRVYAYKELYQAGMDDRTAARTIQQLTAPEENISLHYGDPESFFKSSNKDFETFTPADEYAKEGIIISKADNNRINGKRKVDEVLADLPDGMPGLVIWRNCKNLIRTLPELPRDPIHPEDVDTKAEDHAYDALRYGLTNAARQKPKPTTTQRNPFEQVRNI